MSPKRFWRSLPFFWQTYWITAGLLACMVTILEALEELLSGYFGYPDPWNEYLIWPPCILGLSLWAAYLTSRRLNRRAMHVAKAATRLAGGDFSVRIRESDAPGDPFAVMIADFNAMALKMEQLVTSESRLLADISHELRSPLTRLHLTIALLQRESCPAAAQFVARMEKETERMSELVEMLLQQGKDNLAYAGLMQEIDIGTLLRDIAEDFSFEGQSAAKKAECFIDGPLPVRGNAARLRTMLANVAANALKYTPPGTTVEMRGNREKDSVRITVRDMGPGVPPEDLAYLFRPFFRVDASRNRSTGGSGLGLAIAHQVAQAHGGDISAHNASPGLFVTIRLPLRVE